MKSGAIATLFAVATLTTAVLAQTPPATPVATPLPAKHSSEFKDAQGKTLGTLTVTAAPKGVILRIEAKGLTPGWHGAHFHEKGDCSDPQFKKSGGHVHANMPLTHGLLNAQANDSGDLPNLYVEKDGSVTVELYSTLVGLDKAAEGRPALLDTDGSAVVIHAKPDDYASQPIGGAGDRVACAVIK